MVSSMTSTLTMSPQWIIRAATTDDIPSIARVNIQSWKETYPGIMPEKKLASLNLEGCIRNWQSSMQSGALVLVAELQGKIIGFASGGKNRFNESSETGLGDACDCELAAIYILQEHHRKGIGLALLRQFALCMHKEGHQSMVIWVAEKNTATRFYTATGGALIDGKSMNICGESIPVVAYRYKIDKLLDYNQAP